MANCELCKDFGITCVDNLPGRIVTLDGKDVLRLSHIAKCAAFTGQTKPKHEAALIKIHLQELRS